MRKSLSNRKGSIKALSSPLYRSHGVSSPKSHLFQVCSTLTIFGLLSWTTFHLLRLVRIATPTGPSDPLEAMQSLPRAKTMTESLELLQQSELKLRRLVHDKRIGVGYSYERDAFGSALQYQRKGLEKYRGFWNHVRMFLDECQDLYGLELQVRAILQRGLSGSLDPLVKLFRGKLLQSNNDAVATVLVVGQQSIMKIDGKEDGEASSYPSVLRDLLHKPMKAMGLQLQVQTLLLRDDLKLDHPWNYWCALLQENHDPPDIIVWDLAANFVKDDADLQAFLTLAKRYAPKAVPIFRGITTKRSWDILTSRLDHDNPPTLLQHDKAVDPLRKLSAGSRPQGLRNWPRYPDANVLAKIEHALIARLLSIHILGGLELVALADEDKTLIVPEERETNPMTPVDQVDPPLRDWEEEILPLSNEVFCYTTTSQLYAVASIGGNATSLGGQDLSSFQQPLPLKQVEGPRSKRWNLQEEPKLKSRSKTAPGLQAYFGTKDSGTLSFHFPAKREISRVVLCSLAGTGRQLSKEGNCRLANDITVRVNNISVDTFSHSENGLCVDAAIATDKTPEPTGGSLELQLEVTNTAVTWLSGPCSVAHLFYTLARPIQG